MASINPQGYILGGDPVNTNPFWIDEDSGSSGSSSEGSASSEDLEALETRVETLEEETATIKTEVGELGDELNELNGEVNTLTTQVTTNTENIASIETELNNKLESAGISYNDNTLTLTTSNGDNIYTSTVMLSTDYSGVENVTLTTDEETNTNFNINTIYVENGETTEYTFNTVKESVITQLLNSTEENATNITNLENDKIDGVILTTDSETSEDYNTHTLSVTKGETTTDYTIETVKPSSYEELSEDVAENTNSLSTLIDGNGGEVGQIWTVQEDGTGGWSNFPDGLVQYILNDEDETLYTVITPPKNYPQKYARSVDIIDVNNQNDFFIGSYSFHGSSQTNMSTIINSPSTLNVTVNGRYSFRYLTINEALNVNLQNDYVVDGYYTEMWSYTDFNAPLSGGISGTKLSVLRNININVENAFDELTLVNSEDHSIGYLFYDVTANYNTTIPKISSVNTCYRCFSKIISLNDSYFDFSNIDASTLTLTTTSSYPCYSGYSSSQYCNLKLPDSIPLTDTYILQYVNTLYCSEALFNTLTTDYGLTQVSTPTGADFTYVTWVNTDETEE